MPTLHPIPPPSARTAYAGDDQEAHHGDLLVQSPQGHVQANPNEGQASVDVVPARRPTGRAGPLFDPCWAVVSIDLLARQTPSVSDLVSIGSSRETDPQRLKAVSYTHLTLPTKLEV